MAETEEGLSIRKSILRLARFVTAASVVASLIALLTSGGCGKGLFPEVTPTSGTATPTPVAGAFLYATNFSDGTVSAFQRNTNTGSLSFIAKQSAGAANGPAGLAVTPQNDLAYVANAADGNVYEYTIVQSGGGTPGNLSSLTKIASGNTPQMVAIDSTGSFVYVTNAGSKSVSQYSISSSGALVSNGPVIGFLGKPFGVTAHPSAAFIYVSDNTAGLLYTFSIGSNGVLTQVGTAINSNGTSPGQPGLMAIALDSTQGYLFVDDTVFGVVSLFLIQANGALTYGGTFGTSQSKPIGIGAVNNGGNSGNNYVFTANMTGNFVQPYLRNGAILTQQTSVSDATGPTGLVIDPAGLFAYTGNSGSGKIALIGINNSHCGSLPVCVINSFPSESPANANAGTQFVATTH